MLDSRLVYVNRNQQAAEPPRSNLRVKNFPMALLRDSFELDESSIKFSVRGPNNQSSDVYEYKNVAEILVLSMKNPKKLHKNLDDEVFTMAFDYNSNDTFNIVF